MTRFLAASEVLLLGAAALFTLGFVVSSVREKEKRAALIGGALSAGLLAAGLLVGAFSSAGFFGGSGGLLLLVALLVATVAPVLLLARRTAPNPRALEGTKGYVRGEVKRFDERDEVFARNRMLRPGTEPYRQFYAEHPEWEEFDARRRERGGPTGIPGTLDRPHEGPNVALAGASQLFPMHVGRPEIVKPTPPPQVQGNRLTLSPKEATERVKGYARHLGAVLVGVTEVNPLWVYGRRGEIFYENWEDWGKEIHVDHPYAILFAVEMSRELVWTSPHTPTGIATGTEYARAAFIATQLAAFIANLGYAATANHLRHHEILLVPMAVDAGLGEISRMGYVITKEYGPRIRLGGVTTDLPLVADRPVDIGVEDFCTVCKKCARCCPSRSIPHGGPEVVNGTLRWKLEAESCFDYWGKMQPVHEGMPLEPPPNPAPPSPGRADLEEPLSEAHLLPHGRPVLREKAQTRAGPGLGCVSLTARGHGSSSPLRLHLASSLAGRGDRNAVVAHSATRYPGGHSDLTGGVVIGRKELLEPIWDVAQEPGAR
ncbi:MAG: hypothetical protein HY900_34540 [Deltaproteobacteria bacterium]|nr:hypothetical protein [Deltaproteobacteria bacterium]